jgi:protein-tyrosine kinase
VAGARPECQPVATDGLFAALYPECSQEYVGRFQQLRSQMLLHRTRMASQLDVRTVAVMSTHRGEGKSFTATNLASMLASCSGQRILLVDASPQGLELPTGIDSAEAGLCQALADPQNWEQSVRTVTNSTLSIMPRGKAPERSPIRSAIRSMDFAPLPELLAQLRSHFEWVVLDGMAFSDSPDAEWLSSVTDGTIFVSQVGTSKFDALQDALRRIPEDRMVGVVFNERPRKRRSFRLRLRFSGK